MKWLTKVLVLIVMVAPVLRAQRLVTLHPFLGTGRTVEAGIGGKIGTFLLDTGGGVTNISPEFAAAVGCKPWGRISGYSMMGQRLDMQRCDGLVLNFGGESIKLETVGVFDGKGMMPPDAPHLDGTIALDSFAGRALSFSYVNNTIQLLDRKSQPHTRQWVKMAARATCWLRWSSDCRHPLGCKSVPRREPWLRYSTP